MNKEIKAVVEELYKTYRFLELSEEEFNAQVVKGGGIAKIVLPHLILKTN